MNQPILRFHRGRQQGLALPVMLMMLLVLMISSVYLFKSSNSAALTTGNLVYKDQMSRAADLGLVTAFQWLSTTAVTNKRLLNTDSHADGYLATFDTTQSTSSAEFWTGSQTIVDPSGNKIEYVIHRMCALPVPYDTAGNSCMQTAAPSTLNSPVAIGASLAANTPSYAGSPQLHYVITARIFGTRGGNVVNQMVVVVGV